MKNIIFTAGYLAGDDELTNQKGHRSDVLVEDENGSYYELNFISVDRLRVDFELNIKEGKNYFSDIGLVILKDISKSEIIRAIKNLIKEKYFTRQKPTEVVPIENWFIISLEHNKFENNDDFSE